jgi:hypothetical protein
MIKVYINYPNPEISIHGDTECKRIQVHHHEDTQRVFNVNLQSLSEVLLMFRRNEYKFASEAGDNDMYLFIDLGNRAFEDALVDYVKVLIQNRYTPFQNVDPIPHC